MNNPSRLEERLHALGQVLPYPPTPAIDRAVHLRLSAPQPLRLPPALRWAILALLLITALMAVPRVRAQVLKILRIGIVRIFPAPTAPTPTAPSAGSLVPLTATPRPTFEPQLEPESLTSLQGLAGESTLEEARAALSFPILLPSFPPGLGQPDRIFLQPRDNLVILAWLDPSHPDRARLSLHEIGPGSVMVEKYEPRLLQQTEVNGHPAAWVSGPYLLRLTSRDFGWRRLVEGNSLVWEADNITYRLESPLTLEETLKIAESLQ